MPQLVQYAMVISAGPLVMIRIPVKGKRGRRKNAIPAKLWRPALTRLMARFGMRQKDISEVDNASHPDDWDPDPKDFWAMRYADRRPGHEQAALNFDAAYEGAPKLPNVWLFAWDGQDFALVRPPLEESA